MKRAELFEEAKEGDQQAFIEWSRYCWADIAQFGFQAGVPEQKLAEFGLDVFRHIEEQLPQITLEDAEKKLYLAAIEYAAAYRRNLEPDQTGQALKFEEDIETHKSLQQLNTQKLLPFALYTFHGMSLDEISSLLGESEEKLKLFIHSSKEFLTEKLQTEKLEMTEKRLELLGKSYTRLPDHFPEDRLFREKQETEEQLPVNEPAKKPPVKRGAAAMLAVAGLFLTGVVGASFIFNDENPKITTAVEEDGTMVTDRMVEKWKKEYELIRKNSPGLLGIDPEVYEQLEYVQKADEEMESTFSKRNIEKLRDTPKEMEYQVEQLKFQINTPKGMRDSLTDTRPMIADDTALYVSSYLEKTKQLMAVADGMLEKYRDELSAASVNGKLSVEKLKANPDEYPDELKKLLKSLFEHTLTLAIHPNEEKFRTIRELDVFYSKNLFNNDYYAMQYMELIGRGPYFDETGFLFPVQDLPFLISRLEMFLLEIDKSDPMYEELSFILQHSFYMMLKGDEHTEIFDRDGVVKPEYQQIWTDLAYNSRNPIVFLLMPVIEEMEDSGWTKSEHYDQLAYPDILTALDMEKNGTLSGQMPNGDVFVEREIRNLDNFEYSEMDALYKNFKSDYDVEILSARAPLDTLLLFYYANKIEDPETMWHLLADEGRKPSLEEYIRRWKQLPDIKEEFSSLEVMNDGVNRVANSLYLSVFGSSTATGDHMMGGKYVPTLITEANHIWLVQYQISEQHFITEEKTEFSDRVQALYAGITEEIADNATPGEIAGMYLLALEHKNVEAVRMLLAEPEAEELKDEEIENRYFHTYMPTLSALSRLSFTTETYDRVSENMTGMAEFEYVEQEVVTSNMLWMVKEGESWRINENMGY